MLLHLIALGGLGLATPLLQTEQQAEESVFPFDFQVLELPVESDSTPSVDLFLGSDAVRLSLQETSVRSAHSKKTTATGSTTFRGQLEGEPGSRVAATLRDGSLRALIWRANDPEPWWVGPSSEFDPALPADTHTATYSLDMPPQTWATQCLLEAADDAVRSRNDRSANGGRLSSTTTYLAELLIEADYEYVQTAGSAAAAGDLIDEAVLFSSAIYESTFGIRFEIAELEIWDTASDPYSATTGNGALSEFNTYVRTNYDDTSYDLAQLFTGKQFGGLQGIAYCDRVCAAAGQFTRPVSVTTHSSAFINRVQVTTHEFGHTMGAGHCNENNICNSMVTSDCGIMNSSTVMVGIGMRFGSLAFSQISGNPNLTICMDPTVPSGPAPTLTSVTPSTVEALIDGSAVQTVDLAGVDLDDTHQVSINGLISTLRDLRVIDDTLVYVYPQRPTALGTVDVQALNGAGWSNTLPLTIVATNPPRHAGPTAISFPIPVDISSGGFPGVAYQVLLASDPMTTPVGGVDILANPDFVDVGVLDAAGLAESSFNPGTFGITYWAQLVTRDENGALYATTPSAILYQ